jgi:MtN3 and saliva related transmembrane protein
LIEIGFIAGTILFIAQLTQVIKSWRTKKTLDISLPLYTLLWVGIMIWVIHGYLVGDMAVFWMNVILEVLMSIMIFLKLKYGMKKI